MGGMGGLSMKVDLSKILLILAAVCLSGCPNKRNSHDASTETDAGDMIRDDSGDTAIDETPHDGDTLEEGISDISDSMEHDVSSIVSDAFPPMVMDRDTMECGDCCRQVSLAPQDVMIGQYDVWRDWLVYRGRNQPPSETDYIWLVDLRNLVHYQLEEADYEDNCKVCGYTAVYENLVIYTCGSLISSEGDSIASDKLILVNLETGEKRVIYEREVNYSRIEWGPSDTDFYGEYVVWSENRQGGGGRQEVFMMNISTGEETRLSQGGCCAHEPRIWKNIIVWWDFSIRDNVMIYNIDTAVLEPVYGYDVDRWGGAVWESRVAWFDTRNGGTIVYPENSDVFMKDISTGDEVQVTTDPSTQWRRLDIFGDIIVWMDKRNCTTPPGDDLGDNTDVYARNLSTGEERNLTPMIHRQQEPKVWGDRAFFMMPDGIIPGFSLFEIDLKCIGFVE